MRFEEFVRDLAARISDEELAAMATNEDVAEALTGDELADLLPEPELAELLTDDELADLLPEPELAELLTDDELADLLTVQQAQQALRGALGRGASRWIADQAGIAPRTARRWLSRTPPRARHRDIIDLALRAAGSPLRAELITEVPFEVRTAAATRASAAQRRAALDQAPLSVRAAAAVRAPADLRVQAAAGVSVQRRAAAALSSTSEAQRAATVLAGCTGHVGVGTVEVRYDADAPETRRIGQVDIDLAGTVRALEQDDLPGAEYAFGWEVLEAYGPGLGDTLRLTDYRDGIDLS